MKKHALQLAVLCGFAVIGSALLDRALVAHDLVDYRTEIQPIFNASCGGAGCHIGEAASGVDLTSYESLMASIGALYQAPPVIPANFAESSLYTKLIEDSPLYGERMPPAAPLDVAQVATIRSWIREGARPSPPVLMRGDADGDGQIIITDAIVVLGYLFLGTAAPACEPLADANADGKLDLTDPINILTFLFVERTELPALTHEEEDACAGLPLELSFASIQEKIFSTSCASSLCHDAEAAKAGLILDTLDDSYQTLVNAVPFNLTAREAGLLRVDPGRPENSFLLRKLQAPELGEGNRMPLAAQALSDDRIAAIREWILAGAPREGTIPGVPDITDSPPPPPDRLEPPPVPEPGMQIRLTPFQIARGREKEIFELYDPGFTENVFVNRIEFHMTENSHHFILYTWNDRNNLPPAGHRLATSTTGVGSGRHTFIAASQQSFFSLKFPQGAAMRFGRGTLFDLNSHYLNLNGTETLVGEVYVNLFFIKREEVTRTVRPLFDGTLDLFIPPGETRTARFFWPSSGGVSRETHIHSLTSHMHRHGVQFKIFRFEAGAPGARELLYDNLSWDDPLYSVFDPPLVLQRGEGLISECTHTNHDRPIPLRFGLLSEDEMCFLLGFYSDG